jgi:hypothetical protein
MRRYIVLQANKNSLNYTIFKGFLQAYDGNINILFFLIVKNIDNFDDNRNAKS